MVYKTLREKFPYLELLWSSRVSDQNNSENGHFLSSEIVSLSFTTTYHIPTFYYTILYQATT